MVARVKKTQPTDGSAREFPAIAVTAADLATRIGPAIRRNLSNGGGKSGGYRGVTFYSGINIPVFLITVFGKGEKEPRKPREIFLYA
jgi:hypothetical protein